jgi:hypothetical protein
VALFILIFTQFSFERDTVSPNAPTATLTTSEHPIDQGQVASIYGETLNLSLIGEARTSVEINITADNATVNLPKQSINQTIDNNGVLNINDVIGSKMACGKVEYVIKVKLWDAAKNVSAETTIKKVSKVCPVCGDFGATVDNSGSQVTL